MTTREQKSRRSLKLAAVLTAAALLCAGILTANRYFYGDSSAPFYTVPDEWHAYVSVVDGKCSVRFEYKVSVLKAARNMMSIVPLFPEGTVFHEIHLNGKPIVPVKQDGWVCAEIRMPGDYLVTCRADVKTLTVGEVSSCRLEKAMFVRSAVHIDSDSALEFSIADTPETITGSPEAGTHGVLYAGLLQDVTVRWRAPREKPVQQGTVSIKPSVVWTIKEKVLSADAILDASIIGGTRDRIVLRLPKGSTRVVIPAGAVADWRQEDDLLTLFFGRKVGGRFQVNMSYDVTRSDAELARCPAFVVEDGRVESGGFLVVVNDTPGVLLESSRDGLEPVADIDVSEEVRGRVKGKPLFVYRSRKRDAEPVFDVVTKSLFPMVDTIADRAQILTVVYEGGEEITRIVYTIRNNNRQFLRMAMPSGCRMLSVSVDHRSRTVSEKNGLMLVPLVDSVQTLGGLVPFPVEVIYCRQGAKLSSGGRARIDLPELPDVPVAVVSAKLFYPEKLAVDSYHSSLSKTEKLDWRDDPAVWMAGSLDSRDSNDRFNDVWLYNSYQAGYRAYRENRLEDAEAFLVKTAKSGASGKDLSSVSEDLLGNIKAGRGEVIGRDKLEKAQISAIQGSLASMNAQLETQQSQLINVGLVNIARGNEELGAELLKEAERMGTQVASRGGSTLRQQALRKNYGSQLKAVEADRRKNRELEEMLSKLQREARDLTKNAPVKARRLGKGLVSAASEENLTADIAVSDIAWGPQSDRQELSAGAKARTLKQKIVSAPGKAPAFTKKTEQGKGLKDRNVELGKKVSVLQKALSFARQSMSDDVTWEDADSGYLKESMAQKKKALADLRKRVSGRGRMAMNDYMDSQNELKNLKEQVAASKASFKGIGSDVDSEILNLEQELSAAEKDFAIQGDKLKAEEVVTLTITNAIDTDNLNTVQSFSRYIAYNYSGGEPAADGAYEVKGDQMAVRNSSGEAGRLSEVIEKFAANDGSAVQFGGRRMNLNVQNIPVLANWFSNTAANGSAFAVLDEAQYRTLAFAAAGAPGEPSQQTKSDVKDVVVGTSNSVAGKMLRVANAEADGNGIQIDGSEVFLGHDKYYAVADEQGVTVIKGGAVHNWQEDSGRLELDVELPYRMEIPESGLQMSFEKTLLSAGESPDIELRFES